MTAFSEGHIEVSWDPASDQRPASETITEHLQAGRYEEAIPLLETTLRLEPNDLNSLTNLGMVYSDLGRLEETRQLAELGMAHRAQQPLHHLAEVFTPRLAPLLSRSAQQLAAGEKGWPRLGCHQVRAVLYALAST